MKASLHVSFPISVTVFNLVCWYSLRCRQSNGPPSADSLLDPEESRLSNPHRSKSCHARSDLNSGNTGELKNYILTNNPQVSTGL